MDHKRKHDGTDTAASTKRIRADTTAAVTAVAPVAIRQRLTFTTRTFDSKAVDALLGYAFKGQMPEVYVIIMAYADTDLDTWLTKCLADRTKLENRLQGCRGEITKTKSLRVAQNIEFMPDRALHFLYSNKSKYLIQVESPHGVSRRKADIIVRMYPDAYGYPTTKIQIGIDNVLMRGCADRMFGMVEASAVWQGSIGDFLRMIETRFKIPYATLTDRLNSKTPMTSKEWDELIDGGMSENEIITALFIVHHEINLRIT